MILIPLFLTLWSGFGTSLIQDPKRAPHHYTEAYVVTDNDLLLLLGCFFKVRVQSLGGSAFSSDHDLGFLGWSPTSGALHGGEPASPSLAGCRSAYL